LTSATSSGFAKVISTHYFPTIISLTSFRAQEEWKYEPNTAQLHG
jgi:hypothetical protein